jgi:hypothetical protein
MALKTNKLAAATALAAAVSMLAAPVAAAELPMPAGVNAYDGDGLNAERHRRWRHRDNDIDAGDVVAGVAILGVIAAIAGAAKSRRDRDRDYDPDPDYDRDAGYQTPGDYQRTDGRGIDRAVDMCVGEVERGSDRVGSVDNAARSADGWHVSGQLENGAPYSCTIGNDGRIGDVFVGDRESAAADGQWSDDYYAKARAEQDDGAPVPNDEYDYDDGRYETAQAPDFDQ